MEVGEHCGCIAVDVQVQAVGPHPPLACFRLQTRPPLRQQHILELGVDDMRTKEEGISLKIGMPGRPMICSSLV
jgi:hypothetical protein